MDVFELRDRLIKDYSDYINSYINIRDEKIKEMVQSELDSGLLWPDPLIQLNPSFEPGGWIDDLVKEGVLHKECSKIFRRDKTPDDPGVPLRLHKHQDKSIRIANEGHNYILTTGTGSGKSLAYIIPIVDYILRNESGKGIKAIIVYPMNALANSQLGELEKYLFYGYPKGQNPVTFQRYTGQEDDKTKQEIVANPPDILLTNYVMLELILTRPSELNLIKAAQNLQFLVLDELHTYRGRQGADVAMLVRRTRNRLAAESLQCIGTSATIAGVGSFEEQREEVAQVAGRLFGDTVLAENVIGETLKRETPNIDFSKTENLEKLTERISDANKKPPIEYDEFINDPLSVWIESTFGITEDKKSGRLVRSYPRCITGDNGAAQELSTLTGISEERCIYVIEEGLMAGYTSEPNPETKFPVFAFRLHQFISRGDTIYSSIDKKEDRYISLNAQKYVPGHRDQILLPLAFCRECGQEYYTVRIMGDPDTRKISFKPRDLMDRFHDETSKAGFLYISSDNPWPHDKDEIVQRLPDEWLIIENGTAQIRRDRIKNLPKLYTIEKNGIEDEKGIQVHYMAAPFRFCPNCGISYDFRQSDDFGKLSTIGTGGRSTATSLLSLSTILNIKNDETLSPNARKLLSFTDNRQDASLQAGHFNDFVELGLLRSGLYKAVKEAGEKGLLHDSLTLAVFKALNLPLASYTHTTDARYQILDNIQRALRNVLGYRLYRDLKRGWRITSPNLEQCGLLEIHYLSVPEICSDENLWRDAHKALAHAEPETRIKIVNTLLDFMRRELAIDVDYLKQYFQETIQQQSNQWLIYPWAVDESEKYETESILFPRSRRRRDFMGNIYLSSRSGYGQFLRRSTTFTEHKEKLSLKDTEVIILQIFEILSKTGLVKKVREPREKNDVPGYQLMASVLVWKAGKGEKAYHDLIRVPNLPEDAGKPNYFFKDYYTEVAPDTLGLEAREHTAQVYYEDRVDRENRFREARLPILYCSPTMELGIDIKELNVVNMRNIPPTPANYAQRSGRAGRSGQPALVFSYCTAGSPHDQYFFKWPELMVSGAVTPPRIDLTNEDLIRSHVHSIWLSETQLYLGMSLKDILDLSGEEPSLNFIKQVQDTIKKDKFKQRAIERGKKILSTFKDELEKSDWYSEGWLEEVMTQINLSFDDACNRWRGLYTAALNQARVQTKIIHDATRTAPEKDEAKRLRREAEEQLRLLTEAKDLLQSDFYSYRYFASEGFLPGYNFPRLPLSAYIPSIRKKHKEEYLNRPRFLAISEFGPRTLIYHEGSRYVVNKVLLPVSDEDVLTQEAKLCDNCGYLHPVTGNMNADICERCGDTLPLPLTSLFRMQNVITKRRERINSDEEYRTRLGYEIITGVRFREHGGIQSYRTVLLKEGNNIIANLFYSHAANLWRINLGWKRRKEHNLYGFILDTERGYWARNEQIEEDEQDPMSQRRKRVIPYVEDRKNCIIFAPTEKLSLQEMASLEAAIKNSIMVLYQLEDREIETEPLPTQDNRKQILFYEKAEGGAGVLRRIIETPDALRTIAKKALEICHFNPETGEDLKRDERAKEDCEAACYNCLLSYYNQSEHDIIDRKLIKDYLMLLSRITVEISPGPKPRAEHLRKLMRLAGSELEKEWLRFLEDHNLRLPTAGQKFIDNCKTRPDFYYSDYQTAVYIDGPVHEYKERHERDAEQTYCMENLGYLIVRFDYKDNWLKIINKYPQIFGKEK